MLNILDKYIKVFPISTSKPYNEESNISCGPFTGPTYLGTAPYWTNHDSIVTTQGFDFPDSPALGSTWPMVVPNTTGVKAVLLDNNNGHSTWVGSNTDYHFTAISPDKKLAAILVMVDDPTVNKVWAVIVFDIQTTGNFDATFKSETHLPANPMGVDRIFPTCLAIDNSGNFYIAGWNFPAAPDVGAIRMTVRKFNAEGVVQWTNMWHTEETDVYPPSYPSYYAQWGEYRWKFDDFPWTAGQFLDCGVTFKVRPLWCSLVPTTVQAEFQIASDAAFSSVLWTQTKYSEAADGTPPYVFFSPTWGDLGYGVETQIEDATTGINLYARARVILSTGTSMWSNTNIIHFYKSWDGLNYYLNRTETRVTPYESFPTYTLHMPKVVLGATPMVPPHDMRIVGSTLYLACGGKDRVYAGTYSGEIMPDYTDFYRVWLFTISMTDGSISWEVADSLNSALPFNTSSGTTKNAGVEMLVNGTDIYLCPTFLSYDPTTNPVVILCRHGGVWSRLHLHLPTGTDSWCVLRAGGVHLFMHKGKPYLLTQGDQQTANSSALCWLYAQLDPTTQDQVVVRKNMPQFTNTYGGTTYTYGYWGGCTFSPSFDGNALYVSGGAEGIITPTLFVYRLYGTSSTNSIWYQEG